ncbi:hypothetical protein [Desulfovibrio sp. JC022]|uniref:hypothetical protein n=1 Tax=Desulfovibrio sp. JC022 TaxID=2593642 RepID=UPI0013D2F751|nr:hypothetical protein [Desulfovibrio sp. JC022]NDV21458.1 hypothetical protein [Desulfovibrio sp. JC022]
MKKIIFVVCLCLSVFLALPSMTKADPKVALADIYSSFTDDISGAVLLISLQGHEFSAEEYEGEQPSYNFETVGKEPMSEEKYYEVMDEILKSEVERLDKSLTATTVVVSTKGEVNIQDKVFDEGDDYYDGLPWDEVTKDDKEDLVADGLKTLELEKLRSLYRALFQRDPSLEELKGFSKSAWVTESYGDVPADWDGSFSDDGSFRSEVGGPDGDERSDLGEESTEDDGAHSSGYFEKDGTPNLRNIYSGSVMKDSSYFSFDVVSIGSAEPVNGIKEGVDCYVVGTTYTPSSIGLTSQGSKVQTSYSGMEDVSRMEQIVREFKTMMKVKEYAAKLTGDKAEIGKALTEYVSKELDATLREYNALQVKGISHYKEHSAELAHDAKKQSVVVFRKFGF